MRARTAFICLLIVPALAGCEDGTGGGSAGSGRAELGCATPAPVESSDGPTTYGPVVEPGVLPLLTTTPASVETASTANVQLKPAVSSHRLEMIPASTVRVVQSAPGTSSYQVTESNTSFFRGTLTLDVPQGTQEMVVTLVTEVLVGGMRRPASASIVYLGPSQRPEAPPALARAKANLLERLSKTELDMKVGNIEKVSSIPFLPLQPEVEVPLLGPTLEPLADVVDEVMELPLATEAGSAVSDEAQRFPATVRVMYEFHRVTGFSDDQAIPLNEFSRRTSGVLRVVPVVQATETTDLDAGIILTIAVTFQDPQSGQCDEVRRRIAMSFPRPTLRIPPILALYRAASMGQADPPWRTRGPEISGLALYIATDSFEPLNVEGLPLQRTFAPMEGLPPVLRRLEQMLGPWQTVAGDHGPTGGLAAPELANSAQASVLGPFLRLKDALSVLLASSAQIIARGGVNGPRTFRTYLTSKAVHLAGDPFGWFRDICWWPCHAVHVNDESEAALVLGPANTAFRFFGQDNFGTGEGVTQIQTDADGFAAVIPDLAVVGPCPVDNPVDCHAGSGSVLGHYPGVPSRAGWLPGWFPRLPGQESAVSGANPIETAYLRDHQYGGPGYGLIKVIAALRPSRGVTVPGPDVRDEAGLSAEERGPRSVSPGRSISSFCLWDLRTSQCV